MDYVLLDKNKNIIEPVYSYRDNRTIKAIEDIEKFLPFENLYEKTGIQKTPYNTIYQLYSDKKSNKLDKAEYFLMLPDYLLYTLTGIEYTIATTTALTDANKKDWDRDIIKELDFPEHLFKKLYPPMSFSAPFNKETENYVGFSTNVVLCPSHDNMLWRNLDEKEITRVDCRCVYWHTVNTIVNL